LATQTDARVEVSVVIPCLNEADTLAQCVASAQAALKAAALSGEVIVADNGSDDGSPEIAERCGARVVRVAERGYGSALMGGIAAARGEFVVMADADGSYDFGETPKFVAKLREGHDLVMGCRLPSGGGVVCPGAMPFLHRWWGNPMFTFLARWMFRSPVHDTNCGMRAFTRRHALALDQRCMGMEFANEMVIKSALTGAKIAEVPVTLHRDGRKAHKPHLKTFRDGWRTLRFYLLCSPRWLFLVPGLALVFLGLVGYALAFPRLTVFGAVLDVHTLLFSSLAVLMGYQAILFAVLAKTFAVGERLLPADGRMTRFLEAARLEKVMLISLAVFLGGVALLAAAVWQWWRAGFGPLDYSRTMRLVIPGVTLAALGFQSVMSSCFLSILALRRR
jgi:glycosyltransferase involved in cell wall biosynthesis